MKIRVLVPRVDVADDENFTRRLRVLTSGNLQLDIQLDCDSYKFDFDVDLHKEIRVETYQNNEPPVVYTGTVSKVAGTMVKDETFEVVNSPAEVVPYGLMEKEKSNDEGETDK